MNEYGLSEEHYNLPVSDVHAHAISQSHCEHWRHLHSYLELDEIVVSNINRGPDILEEDKRNTFFKRWRKMKGSEATYLKLVHALLKINCKEDAESVCQLLAGSIRGSSSTVSIQACAGMFMLFVWLQ